MNNKLSITGNSNIVISNGRMILNGNDITPEGKEIHITINGNIDKLEVDICSSISVTGDCVSIKTSSGNVSVSGQILGSISSMSGDIECEGSIMGNVSTMSGNIKQKGSSKSQ